MESLRPRFDKNALALKKAKEIKHPDVYAGQSQKHLDRYFRQVKLTFWLKSIIYASEEDKCVYAGKYLGKTSVDDWVVIDQAVKESNKVYSFEVFQEMLQNGLLLKAQRESKLFACLKALS